MTDANYVCRIAGCRTIKDKTRKATAGAAFAVVSVPMLASSACVGFYDNYLKHPKESQGIYIYIPLTGLISIISPNINLFRSHPF